MAALYLILSFFIFNLRGNNWIFVPYPLFYQIRLQFKAFRTSLIYMSLLPLYKIVFSAIISITISITASALIICL